MGQICSRSYMSQSADYYNGQSDFRESSYDLNKSVLMYASKSVDQQSESSNSRDSLFHQLHVGNYMPCYKNQRSEIEWSHALSIIEQESIQKSFKSKQSTLPDKPELTLYHKVSIENVVGHLPASNTNEKLKSEFHFLHSDLDCSIFLLYRKNPNHFRKLVINGPPQRYRWSSWKTLLLVDNQEFSQQCLYERRLERISRDSHAIEKDTDRTLSNHTYFDQASIDYQFGQNQLQRVLNAIANTLPQLGYCQGMNFLSGLMLIVSSCDESMCYSCFLSLLLSPKHMLYFLYCPDMPYHDFLAYMILKQVKKFFPKLHETVKKENIPATFWISKMIISLFLYIMNLSNCVRIWDYIITRGVVRALPELVLAVVYNIRDKLENVNIEQFALTFQGFVIASEKDQDSFDKSIHIGSTLYEASQRYKLTREQVVIYAEKFCAKNKKHKYIKFYKLFTHFQNDQSYSHKAKKYIKYNVEIVFD